MVSALAQESSIGPRVVVSDNWICAIHSSDPQHRRHAARFPDKSIDFRRGDRKVRPAAVFGSRKMPRLHRCETFPNYGDQLLRCDGFPQHTIVAKLLREVIGCRESRDERRVRREPNERPVKCWQSDMRSSSNLVSRRPDSRVGRAHTVGRRE